MKDLLALLLAAAPAPAAHANPARDLTRTGMKTRDPVAEPYGLGLRVS
jgi:hypothetical protein